ncbi:PRC-barrel domain-containing protein [Desulfonatronum lacustre]|uniref:PRC-barrel domain-containing protein n=1 Tax=Desulfonatronum lacustre TaxID=66849 RepID=UPI00049160E3|nr:PRC-barrel domain-containing protein [Desulfonatronum lacustre]
MKTLLTSIIIGLLSLSPAFAEQQKNVFIDSRQKMDKEYSHASEVMGKDVYVTRESDVPKSVTEEPQGWENIGSIDDFIVTRDGDVQAVLINVGGFLGMGGRTVAVDMKALEIVEREGQDDYYFVLPETTKEQLENAPEYQAEGRMGQRGRDNQREMRQEGRMDTNQQKDRQIATDPMRSQRATEVEPQEGYQRVSSGLITADDLQGASVYGSNNESVADVKEVLMTPDGKVELLIVDVGGFLGMGARSIAIDVNEADIHKDANNDVRVYIPMSEKELRQMPVYKR